MWIHFLTLGLISGAGGNPAPEIPVSPTGGGPQVRIARDYKHLDIPTKAQRAAYVQAQREALGILDKKEVKAVKKAAKVVAAKVDIASTAPTDFALRELKYQLNLRGIEYRPAQKAGLVSELDLILSLARVKIARTFVLGDQLLKQKEADRLLSLELTRRNNETALVLLMM